MNTDTIPTIVAKTLDILSAKFGATGAALWQALVGYTRVEAAAWMLTGSIAFGVILYLLARWTPTETLDPEDAEFTWVVKHIGMIVCILIIMMFIGFNASSVICPQGYVILGIMGAK